jgi:hypothetical protein
MATFFSKTRPPNQLQITISASLQAVIAIVGMLLQFVGTNVRYFPIFSHFLAKKLLLEEIIDG